MQWIEISSVYRKLPPISQPWYLNAETVLAKSRSYTLIMTLKKGMNKLFKTVHCHCHWVDIKGGGQMGRMGCGPPLENSNLLNLHGKITWPKICLEPPWKTWTSLEPSTTNFPRKKNYGSANDILWKCLMWLIFFRQT